MAEDVSKHFRNVMLTACCDLQLSPQTKKRRHSKERRRRNSAISMWDPVRIGGEPDRRKTGHRAAAAFVGTNAPIETAWKRRQNLDEGGKMQSNEQHHNKRGTADSVLQQTRVSPSQYPLKRVHRRHGRPPFRCHFVLI